MPPAPGQLTTLPCPSRAEVNVRGIDQLASRRRKFSQRVFYFLCLQQHRAYEVFEVHQSNDESSCHCGTSPISSSIDHGVDSDRIAGFVADQKYVRLTHLMRCSTGVTSVLDTALQVITSAPLLVSTAGRQRRMVCAALTIASFARSRGMSGAGGVDNAASRRITTRCRK